MSNQIFANRTKKFVPTYIRLVVTGTPGGPGAGVGDKKVPYDVIDFNNTSLIVENLGTDQTQLKAPRDMIISFSYSMVFNLEVIGAYTAGQLITSVLVNSAVNYGSVTYEINATPTNSALFSCNASGIIRLKKDDVFNVSPFREFIVTTLEYNDLNEFIVYELS